MSRSLISLLLLLSLLFMGVETGFDNVFDEHDVNFAHMDSHSDLSDAPTDSAHIDHCSHTHSASSNSIQLPQIYPKSERAFADFEPDVIHLAQSPPTPPPTA